MMPRHLKTSAITGLISQKCLQNMYKIKKKVESVILFVWNIWFWLVDHSILQLNISKS